MYLNFLFLFLFFTLRLSAQSPIDAEGTYNALIEKVAQFVLDDNDKAAWESTVKAAKIWQNTDLLFGTLEAFETGASFYISKKYVAKNGRKNYKMAAKYYAFSLANFQQPFDQYLDDEVEYLADINTLFGFALKKNSQIIEAKNAYQKAFAGYRHLDYVQYDYDKRWISLYVYKPLANIYTRLENYENAEALLLLSKSTLAEWGEADEEAQTAIDLGILQATRGKHEEAIQIFSKYAETYTLSPYISAVLLLNRAKNLLPLQQYEKAFKDVKKAMNNIQKGKYPIILLDAYHVLGQLQAQTLQFKKAANSLKKAINIGQRHLRGSSRKLAKVYVSLGELYLAQKKPLLSLIAFQKCLAAVIPNIDTLAVSSTPKKEHLYAENSILTGLTGKSAAFDLLHTLNPAEPKALPNALKSLLLAFEVEYLLQNTQQHAGSKIQFQNQNRHRKETALRICFQLYKETKEQQYLHTAFQIMEAGKSAVLLSSVRENFARQQLAGQTALLSRLSETKQALATIETEILETSFVGKKMHTLFTQLNEQKVFLSQKLLSIQEKLKKNNPQYGKMLNKQPHLTVKNVQEKILTQHDEAFVEYFWGTDFLYVFIITQSHFDYKKILLSKDLLKSINDFLSLFSAQQRWNTGATLYQNRAADVYQKIYAPLGLEGSKKVIIIPDGLLAFVSFEALIQEKKQAPTFKRMDYLIHRQNIQYAYSGNIWLAQSKKVDFGKQFLFVAPVFNNKEQGLPRLDMANLDIGQPKYLKKLLYENASRANFEKEAKESRIIHLFTHAEADGKGQPKIYFHDQFLSLAEIYALNLSAELVVLSACETNLGKLEKGEGVMSLARGFAYAGATGLIASLWKVKSQQTATLFSSFYQQKNTGISTGEALRNAKLNYLEEASDIHASPAYWTGFVFIGNDYANKKKGIWRRFGGGLLLFTLFIVLLRKRKAMNNTR